MKKVLFLVGPHASGKTYSSKEYIANKENIKMIDTGPIIRNIHQNMDPNISIGDWVKKMELQYGKNITSQLILTEINKVMLNSECDNFILIGFRTLQGIAYIIEHLRLEDYSILYVDAPPKLLYKNYITREKTNTSFEEFTIHLENDLKSGLEEIKKLALLDNKIDYYYRNSNYDSFKERIDSYFTNSKTKKLTKE